VYVARPNSRLQARYRFAGMGAPVQGLYGFLDDLAGAITRQEGACSAPGICRNNNPGNLRAYAPGQPVDSRGIRIFPTYEAGYQALIGQEQTNIGKGLTLSEFFGGKSGVYPGYAPAADSNNPTGYAANVSSWLGIPTDVPLSTFLSGGSVDATGFVQPGSTDTSAPLASTDLPETPGSSSDVLGMDSMTLAGVLLGAGALALALS
jgi:hypothetical protein